MPHAARGLSPPPTPQDDLTSLGLSPTFAQEGSTLGGDDGGDDSVDAHSEFQSLLRQHEVVEHFRPASSLFAVWSKIVVHCSYAVLFLGALEFLIAFGVGTETYVGSFAARLLGVFGLASSCVAATALYGMRELQQHRTAEGIGMLTLFFNLGALLFVAFFVFAVAVLALSPLFWTYVEVHWSGNVDQAFPDMTAETAMDHVRDTVLAVGATALITSLCLGLALMGSVFVRPKGVFNDQSFLWAVLSVGVAGAAVVGVSTYTIYHEADIPVTLHEASWLHTLGLLYFAAALLGLARMRAWPKHSRGNLALFHTAALAALAAVTLRFCALFYHRAHNVADFLSGESEFARFGLYNIRGDDELRKLQLAARIQASLYGTMCFMVALYGALGAAFSARLPGIMEQLADDRQNERFARGRPR